ncbi:RlmE family RNA methyltransferase [Nitrosomonas sp. JL21]|uniref:RlmE family RNA methyltransferase n=1 Tax=Nitrosomonas sp. JL21 TaxID=153949 RepID=UPI00136D0EFD|nr:RlmE family RNA methyltransferase [Nitrosomonas sp. JL21]MBL8497168.1 RlmE family RNA methyltransferase [Nitrosomonas sp.]MCC7092100.1 RlmE family RNA methyltransferase [Nitrosomonas sp.]MXS76638.1 RlmE family RNA methyltransferase [Nitrosomonas sp. JL21]
MKPSKTSKAWMKEHVNDFFVKQAQKDGYRSRAAYKLLEIDERDHILKPGMLVIDLGAAPGSWSQVARQKLKNTGKVVALDILEMAPLPGVEFIQGDFREDDLTLEIQKYFNNQQPDLVMSDMAPNMSGIVISDQANSMYLAELALAFSTEHLNYGGNFLVKIFQGRDFDQFLRTMRLSFKQVVIRKPKASRNRSNELYLLGIEKK